MTLLMDFSDMTSTSFGDYFSTFTGTLSTFIGSPPDVSTGAWVIDQDVTGYGNGGIKMTFPCDKVDLSAFAGIQFDVSGAISPMAGGADAGTLPAARISFQVATAQDTVNSVFDGQNFNAPTWGTCMPVGNPPGQYDGTCTSPAVNVPLTSTMTTKAYLWTQIGGGRGQPGGRATPDPTQLMGFTWVFPFNGTVPFHINLTIDNIRLIPPGGSPDAGTDTVTADVAPVDTAPADRAADTTTTPADGSSQ